MNTPVRCFRCFLGALRAPMSGQARVICPRLNQRELLSKPAPPRVWGRRCSLGVFPAGMACQSVNGPPALTDEGPPLTRVIAISGEYAGISGSQPPRKPLDLKVAGLWQIQVLRQGRMRRGSTVCNDIARQSGGGAVRNSAKRSAGRSTAVPACPGAPVLGSAWHARPGRQAAPQTPDSVACRPAQVINPTLVPESRTLSDLVLAGGIGNLQICLFAAARTEPVEIDLPEEAIQGADPQLIVFLRADRAAGIYPEGSCRW